MSVTETLFDYKWVILFYSTILILIYAFRNKFEIHSKIIAMYKTKVGLKLMDKIGEKHRETVKFLGYVGIGAGYIGLFLIVYFLLKNVVTLLSVPDAQSAVSLVVPGVQMPDSPIYIPLISGWIALFIVILVHEFSHGVVARAHKLKVKSSGIFFLGPLMGAFVEPEEKTLRKSPDTTQYSVYAAGPFSNMLLAGACLLLLTYVMAPTIGLMENDVGVEIVGLIDGYPAKDAGLEKGMVITEVNGKGVTNFPEFQDSLAMVRQGDEITITADGKDYSLVTAVHPTDEQKGYLGVLTNSKAKTELVNDSLWFKIIHTIIAWLGELMAMTGLLSMGIGLANLLPLGPVDGGRMLQVTLTRIKGAKVGNVWWRKISVATLILLAINILWPFIFKPLLSLFS